MFEDIGKKIKGLAKAITWIVIAISVIAGVATLFSNVLAGLLTIVIGCLIGWVGSFILYGFGEMIDSTAQIRKNTEELLIGINSIDKDILDVRIQMEKKKPAVVEKIVTSSDNHMIYCTKCGRANIPTMTYCSSCGSKLN